METTNLEKNVYTRNEIIEISQNMQRFGGSFISAIGEALMKADAENERKLIEAFSDECERYLQYSDRIIQIIK